MQVLIDNQVGAEGWENQYHYPDWGKVIRNARIVLRAGEEMVTVRPYQLGGSEELWEVRVMAFVTTEPYQHGVAVW